MTNFRGRKHCTRTIAILMVAGMTTSACITLTAPEKPIEINLTINIRQEVLVKLERDVQDLINKNPGVF